MRRVLIQLGALYTLVVVVFCGAGVFHDKPDWAHSVRSAAIDVRDSVVAWTSDTAGAVHDQVVAWLDTDKSTGSAASTPATAPAPAPTQMVTQPATAPELRGTQHETPAAQPAPQQTQVASAPEAPVVQPAPQPTHVTPAPAAEAPTAPPPDEPGPQAAPSPRDRESHAQVADAKPEAGDRNPPTPRQIALVRDRLRANLSSDLYNNFDLFLYVSKANNGPWAQHMFVFAKDESGLHLMHAWPVSTGRESTERDPHGRLRITETPAGYYELDPGRMLRHHVSGQWNQPMPFAMFFNWVHQGSATGLAIHGAGADDEVALLGTRASAGCVRLAPQAAETLFNLVRDEYRGEMPRFAMDRRKYSTMSNKGELMRGDDGTLVFTHGYRVLVYIDGYGGQELMSALF